MKRLITKREVRELVCYSFAHIDRLEAAGTFPKRVRLGQARVAWVKEEVESWVQARIDARDRSS
jgi:prophage regulatory protein